MSSASVGIIASKPNRFPLPPGVPVDAIPLAMGEEYWAVNETSRTNVSYSQPRYNSSTGEYSGGWMGVPDGTGSSTFWRLESIGTWYVNLSARNLYFFVSGTGSNPPSGSFSFSASKLTQFVAPINKPFLTGAKLYNVGSGLMPQNPSKIVTLMSTLFSSQTSIIQIYYN